MLPETRTLLSMVRTPMSEFQRHAVIRLDAEDFTGVVRLAKKEFRKQGVDVSEEYCERAVMATKQYYALTVFDPLNMHAISDVLDPFWHAHILDTVRYKMLCDDLGGFMHHDPLDMDDTDKVEAVREVYDYTYRILSRIFSESNLDQEFHPREMPQIRMVCRHDVEIHASSAAGLLLGAFPEVPEFVGLKRRYGYQAQQEAVRDAMAAA